MSRKFTIQLHQDPSSYISRAMHAASKNGVRFEGDHDRGNFSGAGLVGHYLIHGKLMTITIERKPVLAPWPVVERKIYEFFTARAA